MEKIEVLIVAALPASGKSEVRRYMASLGPEECLRVFHMGPNVQLDDYPYVEFVRAVDEEAFHVLKLGHLFFRGEDQPFKDSFEWITLVELLNEDYADLEKDQLGQSTTSALALLERIARAQSRAGALPKLACLPDDVLRILAGRLEKQAEKVRMSLELQKALWDEYSFEATVVVEFARGGPHGTAFPVCPPRGTAFSLSRLSPAILEDSTVLNILVSPEESRRKNFARAVPPPGVDDTTMYHGVPTIVMLEDYGLEDVTPLIKVSDRPHTIRIEAHGRVYYLPTAQFDNRVDKTTFLRESDPTKWADEDKAGIHGELKRAMDILVGVEA